VLASLNQTILLANSKTRVHGDMPIRIHRGHAVDAEGLTRGHSSAVFRSPQLRGRERTGRKQVEKFVEMFKMLFHRSAISSKLWVCSRCSKIFCVEICSISN